MLKKQTTSLTRSINNKLKQGGNVKGKTSKEDQLQNGIKCESLK